MIDLTCPTCGRKNEATQGKPGGPAPEAGDWSLYWKCGEVAVFTDAGTLRRPTAEEADEAAADPEVQAARSAILTSATPSEAAAVVWGSL